MNEHLRHNNYLVSESSFSKGFSQYNPTAIIRRWESRIGVENVVVRSYDEAKKDLLADFLSAIDARLPTPSTLPHYDTEASNTSTDFMFSLLLHNLFFHLPRKDFHNLVRSCRGISSAPPPKIEYYAEIALAKRVASNPKIDLSHEKLCKHAGHA